LLKESIDAKFTEIRSFNIKFERHEREFRKDPKLMNNVSYYGSTKEVSLFLLLIYFLLIKKCRYPRTMLTLVADPV
jgi:hypothetical protein